MGSVGSTTSSNVIYDIQTDRLDSYNYRQGQKEDMRDALTRAQEAITSIMNDPWGTSDVDKLYDRLADWFPQSIEGDEAEKFILADTEYITTVDFRLHENWDGKIEARLEPASYSIDEFSNEELYNMGIDKQYLNRRRRK